MTMEVLVNRTVLKEGNTLLVYMDIVYTLIKTYLCCSMLVSQMKINFIGRKSFYVNIKYLTSA